jgi:hypothetical protein
MRRSGSAAAGAGSAAWRRVCSLDDFLEMGWEKDDTWQLQKIGDGKSARGGDSSGSSSSTALACENKRCKCSKGTADDAESLQTECD